MNPLSHRFVLLLALTVVFLVRGVAIGYWWSDLDSDPDAYVALAEGWASSGVFGRADEAGLVRPTAYRPPLYPWVLSWFVFEGRLSRTAVALFHLASALMASFFAFEITRKQLTWLKLSQISYLAGLSSLVVAFDPILLRQSSLVMTENLATTGFLAFWWLWTLAVDRDWLDRWWFGFVCGFFSAGLILLRPTFVVWAILLVSSYVAWFLIRRIQLSPIAKTNLPILTRSVSEGSIPCRPSPTTLRVDTLFTWLIAFTFAQTVVLAPWAIRNSQQVGDATITTTHGGYTLLLANNEILFDHLRSGSVSRQWDENRFHLLWDQRRFAGSDPTELNFWKREPQSSEPVVSRTEIEDDHLAQQSAWATIQRHPWTFVRSCFVRTSWFWAPWPAPHTSGRIEVCLVGVWYTTWLTGFFFGLVMLLHDYRTSLLGSLPDHPYNYVASWIPSAALLIGLSAIHAIYWSNMRMRAPLMPIIYVATILLAANLRQRPKIFEEPRPGEAVFEPTSPEVIG